MSTYTMPVYGTIAFTCDSMGVNRDRPTGCVTAANVRPDQGALWLEPSSVLPAGWQRRGGGHLCPEHATDPRVRVASMVWNSSTDNPTGVAA